MNHVAVAYRHDGTIIASSAFSTADEAYHQQKMWAVNAHIMPGLDVEYIARYNDGMLMTLMRPERKGM